MRRFSGLLLFLVVFSLLPARGQRFDMEQDRVQLAALNGPWRFHVGDNPQWAKPDFDDSGWKLKKPDAGWDPKAEGSTDGFSWYRLHVRIPTEMSNAAVFVSFNTDVADVYIDGQRICGWGSPPPHVRLVVDHGEVCLLPKASAGTNVTMAMRGWDAFKGNPFIVTGFRLGSASEIHSWARAQFLESYRSHSEMGYLILVSLIGTGVLVLFLLRRNEQEYLWFGVYELFNALTHAVQLQLYLTTRTYSLSLPTGVLCFAIKDLALFLFIARFLKLRERWLWVIAVASEAWVAVAYSIYFMAPQWLGRQLPMRFEGGVGLLVTIGDVAVGFAILFPLYRATRRKVADAAYLLAAFGLYRLSAVIDFAIAAPAFFGWFWPAEHAKWFYHATDWPFPMAAETIAECLTQLALFAILGLRFVRSRRDEERLSSEFEAARVVQQVLVPNEVPNVPGFSIDSVYKPAGQVGGDFYQIVPIENGGALIAIGDVSGKGMPAAMTVSLLVGTFRTLAHYTQSPAEILAAMNRRMLARSHGGFTTCLVLRLDPDGTLTAANAGHLPPYIAGQEIELDNGLPLGLVAEAEYSEATTSVSPGDRLTLLTDGVVEARNARGELFGFERTRALSSQDADHVAAAAQRFGQEDDITVLSITPAAVAVVP